MNTKDLLTELHRKADLEEWKEARGQVGEKMVPAPWKNQNEEIRYLAEILVRGFIKLKRKEIAEAQGITFDENDSDSIE